MALVSARTFSVEETERFAGSIGDPARMVSNYAGVTSANDSRNDIVIRGNSPTGVLWRLEGIDIVNPNHFAAQGTTGGPVSMLNSNLISNSDFFTGAFSAEYGNALSGIFDINLRSGNKEHSEFVGQVGINGFEAGCEGPILLGTNNLKCAYTVDYRYSNLQLMNNLGFDLGVGSAIPKYQDLTFIGDFPTRNFGRFKLIGLFRRSTVSVGRSFDKNEVSTNNAVGTAADFSSRLSIFAFTHSIGLGEKGRVKSSLSYQPSITNTRSDTIDYDHKTYFRQYAGEMNESKLTAATQLKYKLNTKNSLIMGVDVAAYITNYNDSVWNKTNNKFLILDEVDNKQSFLVQSYLEL